MSLIPRWCDDHYITGWAARPQDVGPGAAIWGEGTASGVPFRSLGTFSVRSEGKWYQPEYAIIVRVPFLETTQIPWYPLWPGFVLNTIFYTALAWGLWQLPLAIRRRRHRRAGMCVRCGYDLKGLATGSPCPECGANQERTQPRA